MKNKKLKRKVTIKSLSDDVLNFFQKSNKKWYLDINSSKDSNHNQKQVLETFQNLYLRSYQTRGELSGVCSFDSVSQVLNIIKQDPTIWKISVYTTDVDVNDILGFDVLYSKNLNVIRIIKDEDEWIVQTIT